LKGDQRLFAVLSCPDIVVPGHSAHIADCANGKVEYAMSRSTLGASLSHRMGHAARAPVFLAATECENLLVADCASKRLVRSVILPSVGAYQWAAPSWLTETGREKFESANAA
jgi:hypothetical protein